MCECVHVRFDIDHQCDHLLYYKRIIISSQTEIEMYNKLSILAATLLPSPRYNLDDKIRKGERVFL